MVPGGTNVIPDYDPATIRAMNLSRAENLMSQKHSIQHQNQHGQPQPGLQQQPPPLPSSNRDQMVHHPYPPGKDYSITWTSDSYDHRSPLTKLTQGKN